MQSNSFTVPYQPSEMLALSRQGGLALSQQRPQAVKICCPGNQFSVARTAGAVLGLTGPRRLAPCHYKYSDASSSKREETLEGTLETVRETFSSATTARDPVLDSTGADLPPLAHWQQALFPFALLALPTLMVVGSLAYTGVLASANPVLRYTLCAGVLLFVYGVVPLTDLLLGQRRAPTLHTATEEAQPLPPTSLSYLQSRALPMVYIASYIGACFFAYATVSSVPVDPLALFTLVMSLGVASAFIGAASHELLHSRSPVHQFVAWVGETFVWYAAYIRSHVHHHLALGTPADHVYSPKGRSFYSIAGQYLFGAFSKAWEAEVVEAKRKGYSVWSHHNLCLLASIGQVAITAGVWALWGPIALLMHLSQAALHLMNMTAFDHLLHYGLEREQGPDGKYAPISRGLAWNSHFPLETAMTFNILRHSHHHMEASKAYPALEIQKGDPVFPYPVLGVAMALFAPPLWFSLMDPAVDRQTGVVA